MLKMSPRTVYQTKQPKTKGIRKPNVRNKNKFKNAEKFR